VRAPQISEALERVIMRCLEKRPEHRYQTMPEIEAELVRLRADRPPLGPDTVTLKPAEPRPVRRARVSPMYVGGLSMALLALLGLLAVSAWREQPAEQPADVARGRSSQLEPAVHPASGTLAGPDAAPETADDANDALAAAEEAAPLERTTRRIKPVRRKPKVHVEPPQKHDTAILDPWQ
jgi:hypothetical protein